MPCDLFLSRQNGTDKTQRTHSNLVFKNTTSMTIITVIMTTATTMHFMCHS